MFKTLVVLVVAVCVANALVKTSVHEKKPAKYQHLEGCYIPELDKVIPFYTMAPSNSSCAGYSCSTYFVQYDSCEDPVVLSKGCKLIYDDGKSDPFPDCCGIIVCG